MKEETTEVSPSPAAERKRLIENLMSRIKQANSLDLLSIIGMEFFTIPEKHSEMEFGNIQAQYEYIAGLVSAVPCRQDQKMPSPIELEEIKGLVRDIFLSYFPDFLPSPDIVRTMTPEEVGKTEHSFRIFQHYLNVRGEGYPDQLWTAAEELYTQHNDFLKEKFGFSIQEALEIFRWLVGEIEERANIHFREFREFTREPMGIYNRWRKGEISTGEMLSRIEQIRKSGIPQKLESLNEQIKDTFLVKISDIEKRFGSDLASNFVRRFGAKFGEINLKFREPSDFNELNRQPLLLVNSQYVFIPIPMLLWQVPVKTIHYDLTQDSNYEVRYSKIRGEYLEIKAFDLFENIFGHPNIQRGLRYGPNKEYEVDLLITFDTKLLIVQCKSKRLTLPAKQGSFYEIKDDFTKAIQEAYTQANRTRDHILRSPQTEFFGKNGGKLIIERNQFSDIYMVCITAELFGPLVTDVSFLLQKDQADPYPWIVCLRDLELVSEYLADPYLFLHFLKRRLILHGKVLSYDELDYVGNYLKNGLYFEEEFRKGATVINLVGFTEQFDKDYLRKIGKLKTAQVGTSWSNPAFENLLGSIRLIGKKGHSDVILTLLDLSSESRDNLIKLIEDTVEKVRKNGLKHDFTMPLEDFGISFLAETTRDGLRNSVLLESTLKKYKHKRAKWLGMGRDVTDNQFLVNEFAYLEYDWKYDPEMEEATRLLKGTIVSL